MISTRMKHKSLIIGSALILMTLSSCSLIRNQALKTTSELALQSQMSLNQESSFESFKSAAIPNLAFLAGLLESDRGNKNLLTLLIKGHAGVAYGVYETQGLEAQLLEQKNDKNLKQAEIHYTKAYDYGLMYLASLDLELANLSSDGVLEGRIGEEDHLALFYLGYSMGGLFNLDRSNIKLLGLLAKAERLIHFVCKKRGPEFEQGSCGMLEAGLLASKPAMLGGDIEKARAMFKDLMKEIPLNALLVLNYMQYVLIPMFEDEEYAQLVEKLEKQKKLFNREQSLLTRSSTKLISAEVTQFNLYNSIAFKRLKVFTALKKQIFD